MIGIAAALAVATLIAPVAFPAPWAIVYNPSASAPKGWYTVSRPTEFRVDDFVLAKLPHAIAALADERRYLPLGTPLLKRIGAISGQLVCEREGGLRIDSAPPVKALNRDRMGRALPHWNHCRMLSSHELFLVSRDSAASFDSRYFGPIATTSVIGKAVPLWTW